MKWLRPRVGGRTVAVVRWFALLLAGVVVVGGVLVVRVVREPGVRPVVEDAAAGVERFEVGGEKVVVVTPERARDGGAVVIYAHGRGETAESVVTEPTKERVVSRLLEDGYTVAASDAHGDAWGNDASVRDYVELAGVLRDRGYRRFFVLAQSMGGLAAMRLTKAVEIEAVAAIFPVCDVSSVAALYRESVAAAGGPTGLQRARGGVPVLAWASPDDTRVPKARNADRCADRVVTTRGEHGDASNFRPGEVVRFFASARGQG